MSDFDVTETKAYKKAEKLMGDKNLREFISKSDGDLKELISGNAVHIQEASAKVRENTHYAKACEVKKDFDKALNDDLKPYKVANELAATLLRSRK